ncbi:ThiJ/PfpI family protein [Cordyceps militaris]|uniref:ThiJ/PfpI family protein n=1 Tax=Cordyceps militaris TaxID=73501 RepID=A0A2H4SP20_CORMI|nr:ThiJ/PfpI family protein [Cordyceps militaris]
MSTDTPAQPPPPVKYAVALFPGFQLLDVAGPLDVLAVLAAAQQSPVEVAVLAATLAPVSSRTARPGSVGQAIVPTHTFDAPPADVEVLLVPGGGGTRDVHATQDLVDYVKNVFPKLRYFLSVCTGAALAARAGVLDGRRATTNKLAFDWVRYSSSSYFVTMGDSWQGFGKLTSLAQVASQNPKVHWVRHARWVTDGNVWTSSGISAGIDMTFGFVAAQYGEDVAATVAHRQEYIRNTDPNNDPFAPDSPQKQ